jgi:hypothetical protein
VRRGPERRGCEDTRSSSSGRTIFHVSQALRDGTSGYGDLDRSVVPFGQRGVHLLRVGGEPEPWTVESSRVGGPEGRASDEIVKAMRGGVQSRACEFETSSRSGAHADGEHHGGRRDGGHGRRQSGGEETEEYEEPEESE